MNPQQLVAFMREFAEVCSQRDSYMAAAQQLNERVKELEAERLKGEDKNGDQ